MPALLVTVVATCYRYWDDALDTFVRNETLFEFSSTYRIVALVVLIAVILYTEISYNPNNSSMHRLYRDRLSSAYLVREEDASTLESVSDLKLSKLNQKNFNRSVSPYQCGAQFTGQ